MNLILCYILGYLLPSYINRQWPGPCGSVDWSVILYTKRSPFQLPIRAHTQVACSIPCWGAYERQPIYVTSRFFSPFLSLKSKNESSGEDYKRIIKKINRPLCSHKFWKIVGQWNGEWRPNYSQLAQDLIGSMMRKLRNSDSDSYPQNHFRLWSFY